MLDRRLDDRPQLRHTRGALAHPLSASAWKDALEVRRGDPTVAVALRVGLATMLALVGGGLLGYGQVAGFAALGALTSAFLRYEPYPRLAVRLPWVGLGIVGYTAFGAALGAMGAHAETSMARRYYEAALAEGVVAASPRLEALE